MNSTLHQQLLGDLLVESFEGLDSFDRDLLTLESGQGGPQTLNSIFRTIHTIKGTSGCLGLGRIEKLAHTGENLLDLMRTAKVDVTPRVISALLKLSDSLREMLRHLEANGNEGNGDYSVLTAELTRLLKGEPQPEASNAAPPALPNSDGFGFFDEEVPTPPLVEAPPALPVAPIQIEGFGLFSDEPAAPAAPSPKETPAKVARSATTETKATDEPKKPKSDAPAAPSVADSAIRVDVNQLDRLMNLVGELVLARNQIVQSNGLRADSSLSAAAQRLNIITTELQEGVMKTRMQPIGNVWAKFPRIVRDVSHDLGKQVRLEMEGKETELDRTIIEAIKDPLTHIIRNSIDHGIEGPARRAEVGKPAEGLICMRAYHESSQVNIEIADDGAGLNIERIRAKALEKGLITAEQAGRLSEREVIALIFLPGFSTAEKITNVSGRGVGMDVVKTNIEKIGGSVDVQSNAGEGTVFRLKIPLTLAIVPALLVRCVKSRFAIPRPNLVELVRLQGAAAEQARETVYGAPVLRLRGQLLPLVHLRSTLNLPQPPDNDVMNIVILQADNRQFGLVVDEVCDTEEIVVKPIGKHFKGLPMYAGATIMGDGSVALILDVHGLAQHARVLGEATAARQAREEKSSHTFHQLSQWLLFSLPGRERLALPLDDANRLEEFMPEQVERSGDEEAVQYRDAILPLVRLHRLLPGTRAPAADQPLPVIVHTLEDRMVGLVVGEIVDIIETEVEISTRSTVRGIKGSGILQGKITEFVDTRALLSGLRAPVLA
ncbi:chemotaxis protein CheA [Nibricoccus sp. IMCC34717]|uniref:chemotaxis protein CheA n=1 Tax=Nibricoccus sp. IMCC34717 TaxID=3034021 RepID=UPI00384A9E66